jgi:hypothetical protein
MTTTSSTSRPASTSVGTPTGARPPVRRLVLHYVEMLVAMLVGMVALGPVWSALVPGLAGHADLMALVMAGDMALGMGAWMRVRRHSWDTIAEMSVAMLAPFVVLLVPYWAGSLSGDGLLTWGHLLMLPAMAVPMVRRPHAYAC